MFASATSGDKPNNNKFSQCSVGNMTRVIDSVMAEQFGKQNCFVGKDLQFRKDGKLLTDIEQAGSDFMLFFRNLKSAVTFDKCCCKCYM